MRIRKLSHEDLAAIIVIQTRTPEASRWTQGDYQSLAREPSGLILVADLGTTDRPGIIGFAAFHRVIDEAEVLNMAVDPEYQRQGVGRGLLAEGLRRLLEQGVRRVYLEVRTSNIRAQKLYFSAGLALHYLREDYYDNPREDALVLSRELFAPREAAC